MILEEAHELALLHMEEWGLIDDFDFEFENCKRTLGRCHYYKKKITLSKWYAELNEEKQIEDRKDERTRIQATQQSKMISQRQNDSLPTDFETNQFGGIPIDQI